MTSVENLVLVETQINSQLSIFDLKLKQKYTFKFSSTVKMTFGVFP